jgi:hypothetical protein
VVDVAWSRGVLYVALGSREVLVFRSRPGESPEYLGRLETAAHPVELRVAGDRLLVAELDDGLPWIRCLAGLSCRGGDRAEAFSVSPEAWGDLLGSWAGAEVAWVNSETLRDFVVEPANDGFTVYQALTP